MDRIFLRELRIETIVGIWEWERKMPQTVSVSLEMGADVAAAALTDSIENTIDYKAVAQGITTLVTEGKFQLVETMAERIAEYLMTTHKVPWVRVNVDKPGAIRDSRGVGITIERGDAASLR